MQFSEHLKKDRWPKRMHHPDEPNVYDAINRLFTWLRQIKRVRFFSVKVE